MMRHRWKRAAAAAVIVVAALGVALPAVGQPLADPTEPRYAYTHKPKEGAMPPPKFQGEWCKISERAAGGGWGYRLCKNVPGGGTEKLVITGTTATLTDAKGVVACRAVADLPDPFVANWYVHYDCGGKPHTLRYARMDEGDVPGLRVQFISGPVHNSFVNAERARKAVEEDYAAPKP